MLRPKLSLAPLLSILLPVALLSLARGMQFDVPPAGGQFCFEREAHSGDSIGVRYAVHAPIGSPIFASAHIFLTVARELQSQGPVVSGLLQFPAPQDGQYRICFKSPTTVSRPTTVSIAVLVQDGNFDKEDALEAGHIKGAEGVARVADATLDRVLWHQEEFTESVYRHDIAMNASARSAETAAMILCFVIVAASVMQGAYMQGMLKGGSRRGSARLRGRV